MPSMSASNMNSVFSAKKAVRKATGATLKALAQVHTLQQSQAVRDRIHKQGLLNNARGVSCYLSMEDGELSTTGLVQDILAAKIPLFVPVIPPPQSKSPGGDRYAAPPPEHDMRMLRLYSLEDFEQCPRDKWGIPDAGSQRRDRTQEGTDGKRQDAEDPDAPPLDVILVPGVKFDRACGRVGHGKGYYDRYIQRYRQAATSRQQAPPVLVALALQEQLSETLVPRTESDELVDIIVLPDQVIKR